MPISILSEPDNGLVAREELIGGFGGGFYQESDNRIYYRHEADERKWYVNRDLQSFGGSAAAYNFYQAAVRRTPNDQTIQDRLIQDLRMALEKIEPIGEGYWTIVLEQIEQGLL